MGYRYCDKPNKPEDNLKRFTVRNGAIMRMAFGCYYMLGHNPDLHDHIGWPNPDHPDAICQERSNMRLFHLKHKDIELQEIHLTEEGYDEVAVSFEDEEKSANLEVRAWIDEEEDNIIRMMVGANFPTFSDKPVDLRFTVFVKKSDGSAIDAVCHGFITVLPGAPYPEL
jgi:hypothetical protein